MPQSIVPAEAPLQPVVLVADAFYPRLDVFLPARLPAVTRSQAARLVRDGAVTMNGGACKPAHAVRPGDVVAIVLPEPSLAPQPEGMDIDVVFENADVLVVDKPAGLVVHPAPGHTAHTLVNALLHRYPDLSCGDAFRPGIVHRLDKDTSGLIIVARNEHTRLWLVSQFKQGLVQKEYAALVTGSLPAEGSISGTIGRHPTHRKRMAVVPGGKPARTDYCVRENLGSYTYVSALPRSGRTHQIRVHFASIGHPVAGDRTYGGRDAARQLQPWLTRHFLHAERLTFRPSEAGQALSLISPLPRELRQALDAARAAHLQPSCPPKTDMV